MKRPRDFENYSILLKSKKVSKTKKIKFDGHHFF